MMIRRVFFNVLLSILVGLVPGGSAGSVAELLEKAIYQEETVGDLDTAIEIYSTIVDDADADRPHIAQALYRLGQCQLKNGEEGLATATFRKLVDHYPDQIEWVAKARTHLPEPAPPGLTLEPAPWVDGELVRLRIRAKSGESIGDLTYSVRSATVDGRPAWHVESFLGIPKAELSKYVSYYADKDTFVPLRHKLYHSQLGTIRAEYVAGERRIMMNRPGEPQEPYTQKLTSPTYENEQFLHLARRLPLAEGYEESIQITGRPGVTATAAVKVVKIETVSVPAGTFECFRVEIGVPPFIETQWFSTDANRYTVKVDNPEIDVELTEITRVPSGPVYYEEPATGISLTVPRGWDIQKSAFRFAEHEFFLMLFAPEMNAKAVVVAQKVDHEMTLREFANMDLGIYGSRRSSFQVDRDSWAETEVAGAPAVSLTATLKTENEDHKEYRIYIKGPSAYYWFVYRATLDQFDVLKDDFDSIVDSLTFG